MAVRIVYGAWVEVITDDRRAVARLDEGALKELLKTALAASGGDVEQAFVVLQQALVAKVRAL